MTREDTKKAIEVMQAWVDGAEIEFFDSKWLAIADPVWNWDKGPYRVKPKPREFWIHVSDDGFNGMVMKDDPDCKQCIKVREVLE